MIKQTITALMVSIFCLAIYHFWLLPESSPTLPDKLAVSELTIMDESGKTRVRIGSDLPDAVINGQQVDRGGSAAGIFLYDASGQERSGYVTMDPGNNVMLTLDNLNAQSALFVAGPSGGSNLRLWNKDDAIELRAGEGGARLTVVADGELLLQQPQVSLPDEACEAYSNALSDKPYAEVEAACKQRFTKAQCRQCFEN